MSEFLKCDGGCGSISPDSKGLHQANHWITILIIKPYGLAGKYEKKRKYLFCKECFKRIAQVLTDH